MVEEYKANDTVQSLEILNFNELEKAAEKVIPKGGYGYISSGAGDLWTFRRNIEAFNHKTITPRVLKDIENPDQKTSIFGTDIRSPFIMAPIAAHGLAHDSAEPGTAKGVAEYGSIFSISSYAGKPLEDIAAAGNGGTQWFQLYASKDNDQNLEILRSAEKNGAKAIILTADATVGGNREADKINKFVFPISMPIVESYQSGVGQTMDAVYGSSKQKLSPQDVEFITSNTDLPVFVKGVQSPEDAVVSIAAGAKGIWVSNHGGRQLDGGPAAFDTLESVAAAVNGQVPIVFDSGIRRGQHVFKALASGADIVAIGRPVLYGLSLGGWKGVVSVFEHLERELAMVMQLAGTKTVEEIKQTKLVDNPYGPYF